MFSTKFLHVAQVLRCNTCIIISFSDIDECEENDCKNNATCRDGVNSYNCLCLPGFTGNVCQTGKLKPSIDSGFTFPSLNHNKHCQLFSSKNFFAVVLVLPVVTKVFCGSIGPTCCHQCILR